MSAPVPSPTTMPMYREQAKQRRLATQNNDAGRAVSANWREQESGQARDHVADVFGVSPRSVESAETVYRDRRNLSDADMLRWIGEIDKRKTAGRPKEGEQKLAPSGANLSEKKSSAATAAVVGTSARKVERAGGLACDSLDNSRRI